MPTPNSPICHPFGQNYNNVLSELPSWTIKYKLTIFIYLFFKKTLILLHFLENQTKKRVKKLKEVNQVIHYSLNQIINHKNNPNLKHKSFKILCFESDFHCLKDSNERRKDH